MAKFIIHIFCAFVLLDRTACLFEYSIHKGYKVIGRTESISLGSVPFYFLGTSYNEIHVSDNGWLGFDKTFTGGVPETYTLNVQWISPYGFDVCCGDVQHNLFVSVAPPTTAETDAVMEKIRKTLPSSSFTPTALVISTWVNVFAKGLPDSSKTPDNANTFQAVVASDGTETWVIFQYETLNYQPAVIGVSAGDGTNNWKLCNNDSEPIADQVARTRDIRCNSGGYMTFAFLVHGPTWNQGSSCIRFFDKGICPSDRWQSTGIGLAGALAS